MIKSAVNYFSIILFGSLVSALMGGGFAALIATVSPELVTNIFSLRLGDAGISRYAFSVGMLWGLFIGVGATCFACGLSALVQIIRLRVEHKST